MFCIDESSYQYHLNERSTKLEENQLIPLEAKIEGLTLEETKEIDEKKQKEIKKRKELQNPADYIKEETKKETSQRSKKNKLKKLKKAKEKYGDFDDEDKKLLNELVGVL